MAGTSPIAVLCWRPGLRCRSRFGTAVRIMTGAVLPDGSEAVVGISQKMLTQTLRQMNAMV